MKYSIITPVYNRSDCIERCIKSVCAQLQDGLEIEHIIVDDGSTDSTALIVEKYEKEFDHIKFAKFSINRGTNAARNFAIASATGDYCIILDSDDYFVDDAIQFIHSVVCRNATIKHFIFAPDDMQKYYAQNVFLRKSQSILNYEDFLTGKVNGDFIHVIDSRIMKKFPFDESIRIYEGVFFLRFYKDAGCILFTNRVVTIRERSRGDSVTKEMFRINKVFISRNIKASKIFINWFAEDLVQIGALDVLSLHYRTLLENLLLISDYRDARNTMVALKNLGLSIPFRYIFIYILSLGWLYRIALKFYLLFKYDVLKMRLR